MFHSETLKPCPFCGGEAEANFGPYAGWVDCTVCGVAMPTKGTMKRAEAIAAWNRRALPGREALAGVIRADRRGLASSLRIADRILALLKGTDEI